MRKRLDRMNRIYRMRKDRGWANASKTSDPITARPGGWGERRSEARERRSNL